LLSYVVAELPRSYSRALEVYSMAHGPSLWFYCSLAQY